MTSTILIHSHFPYSISLWSTNDHLEEKKCYKSPEQQQQNWYDIQKSLLEKQLIQGYKV